MVIRIWFKSNIYLPNNRNAINIKDAVYYMFNFSATLKNFKKNLSAKFYIIFQEIKIFLYYLFEGFIFLNIVI